MRNLIPSQLDPWKVFKDIVLAKELNRRSRLNAISDSIRNYYDNYNQNKNELSKINMNTFNKSEREDLEHCYNGKTQPLDRLLASITKAQPTEIRNKCQYCGIDSPNTFDHYLPISLFPEFAVYSLNLLPCCATCNGKKLNAFLLNNERQIVNLYFDSLPIVQYLYVNINYHYDEPVAIYHLQQSSDISAQTFRLIETHYNRLDLLSRFQANSPEVFSETRSILIEHRLNVPPERIREYLLTEAQRYEKNFSKNYWRAVLLSEMANNQRFKLSCLENK